MTFSLRSQEHPAQGLLRIFLGQLSNTRECIADDGRLTDQEIHNARKSIKRSRATLRLLRPALSADVFDETNRALRDLARPLTHVRDAKVLLDALGGLREHFGDVTDCFSTEALEQAMLARRTRSRRELSGGVDHLECLRVSLGEIEAGAGRYRLKRDDWELLGPALERIYRRARAAFARVSEATSDERFHELRKQVKHLWYALQILTPMRPGRLGEIADQTHKLTDYLGDDHDLAILHRFAEEAEEDEDALEALEALIEKRRADLQDRAFAVGERIFAQKPKRFMRKMKTFWRTWHELATLPDTPVAVPRSPGTRSEGAVVQLH